MKSSQLLGALVMLICFSLELAAGGGEKEKDEVVVTATRTNSKKSDLPFTVDTLSKYDLERLQPRVTPEILKHATSVLLQKTSYGQGSPFIRGWTAYHNVFLIDGIRLNHSAFRSGPNQYWSTVDPYIISQVEILKGSASTLYGSDAIGGVVNALTISPDLRLKPGFYPELKLRHATAENSNIGRAQLTYILSPELGATGGFTSKFFDDFTAGRTQGLTPETGFTQRDSDLKLQFNPGDIMFTLAHQRTFQNNVPRTHKTTFAKEFNGTSTGEETKRDLNQKRELTYLRVNADKAGAIGDDAILTLSLHTQNELRDRIKSGKPEHKGFDLNTFGGSLQFSRDTSLGKLTYGADYYKDFINSFDRDFNTDGSLKSHGIQGPIADNSTYDTLGLFVQDEYDLTARLKTVLGLRYSRLSTDMGDINNNGVRQSFDDKWHNLSGSIRAIYSLDDAWSVYFGVSQGFRTPSVADFSKLDDTSAVEEPSLTLDEEKFISNELGLRFDEKKYRGQIVYWYTLIDDLIIQSPTGAFSGGTQVVRKDNIGDGYVNGLELEVGWNAMKELWLTSRFSHMYGQVDQLDEAQGFIAVKKPLSRLMPTTFEVEADYDFIENMTFFSIARVVDKQDKLALRDKNDRSRIPPDGTPGYGIFDAGLTYYASESTDVSLMVENLFNKDYRAHGSGANEPGTNVIISVTHTF